MSNLEKIQHMNKTLNEANYARDLKIQLGLNSIESMLSEQNLPPSTTNNMHRE